MSELPWQLLNAAKLSGEWNEVETLLSQLPFLEAKTEAGLIFELADDISQAVEVLPEHRERRRVLCLLEECIRRDIYFLVKHPAALFQCIWNNGWWYDTPTAAAHYSISEDGEDGQLPWARSGAKLYQLVEEWRRARDPARPWLRSLRPPPESLHGSRILRIRGNKGSVSAIAHSNDGRSIAAG